MSITFESMIPIPLRTPRDLFVLSGAEIRPHSQWNLGAFFPNFEKKIPIFNFFFVEDWDFLSVNTHTSYMVKFSFNLMAIVCVIANLFFIDQK